MALLIDGWYIPGMRNLAQLHCAGCGREFYGDLAAGQALYTPMLLEKAAGVVHDPHGVPWFADWLRDSYASRTSTPLRFEQEEVAPVTRHPLLLNCLDTLYGHCLLKLLNAQHYLNHRPDLDLIILVPSLLRWMVPAGVAQIWTIDLPLRRGLEWNDWLAREISRRVESFGGASLSVAHSHPHPDDYDIEHFTRVKPFPLDEWERRLTSPTVTFVWREDRLWPGADQTTPARFGRIFTPAETAVERQRRLVTGLAEALRTEHPTIDFAVVGLGKAAGLPAWIADMRRDELDAGTERAWCLRYADSHLVVGTHGSHMLLPSAHAGGVVELIGTQRWGNFLQDILFRTSDCREMFFRYRFVAESTTPAALAQLASSVLTGYSPFRNLMRERV
ncbi:MAG: hypothetical protein ABR554_03545 [Pyrinomonadaceae bacterium]